MDKKMGCCICNNMGDEGIILLNKYICRECELDLVGTLIDEFKYEKFKNVIKDIWKGFDGKYKSMSV
ncbi:MAG TPA: sigma factor G inhibitor Gin [Oscillospiraceae bacterium]|nr:sigma factor G inhibitor Gin [Oscillospiraceae bacterium]